MIATRNRGYQKRDLTARERTAAANAARRLREIGIFTPPAGTATVALLYPACRWYSDRKARRADPWLRFL